MSSTHRCNYEVGSCHGESGVAITNVYFRRSLRKKTVVVVCGWNRLFPFRIIKNLRRLLIIYPCLLLTLTSQPTLSRPLIPSHSPLSDHTRATKTTSHRAAYQLAQFDCNGPSCRCVAAVAPHFPLAPNQKQMRSYKSSSTKSTTLPLSWSFPNVSIRFRKTLTSALTTSSRDMVPCRPCIGRSVGVGLLLNKSSM